MSEEKKCRRDGACCKVLPIFTQHMHPDFKKYLLNRGLVEDKEQGCILIPHVCQHLKKVPHTIMMRDGKPYAEIIPDEEIYSCDIHDDPNRPEICRKFRGQKFMKHARIYIPPGCGYR